MALFAPFAPPAPHRGAAVLHRTAVATADLCAVPSVGVPSGQTASGASLLGSATYMVSVAAYNALGATTASTAASAAPGGSNNALRVPITQVAGALGYDLFLSGASNPLWVARITEAQRASGGVITAVGGAPGAGGSAGTIDLGVVGTGVANNQAPFNLNTAYVLPAGVSAINCAGHVRAHIGLELSVTDLRALAGVVLVPALLSAGSSNYELGARQVLSVPPLRQDLVLDVDAATGLVVLLDTIAGQGAAATVYVELL